MNAHVQIDNLESELAKAVETELAKDVSRYRTFVKATWVGVAGAAIAYGIVAVAWVLAEEAPAHEAPMGWSYPLQCCSLRDCRPTRAGEVEESGKGYRLTTTGEFLAYGDKRIKELSEDGDIHVCQQGGNFDSGRVLCLLTPPKSF